VQAQQGQQHDRIRDVILRPRGRECRAEARAGGRMHRVNRQPRILQQGVQQRIASGFDHQGDRSMPAGTAQFSQPGVQRFGRRLDRAGLNAIRTGQLPGERMRLISPVQGHQGRVIIVLHGVFWVRRARAADRIVRGVGDAGS
jgi:hypothetical protein